MGVFIAKFDVGDRVRDPLIDDEGVIIAIRIHVESSDTSVSYIIKYDTCDYFVSVPQDQIELAGKFRIGDKVTSTQRYHNIYGVGVVADIRMDCATHEIRYLITYEGRPNSIWYYGRSLTLATPIQTIPHVSPHYFQD